jgi:hypothetical protein
VVQRVQQVDALDGAAFAVVEVPAHDVVLVRPGLLLDGVVKNQAGIIPLDLADNPLDLNTVDFTEPEPSFYFALPAIY